MDGRGYKWTEEARSGRSTLRTSHFALCTSEINQTISDQRVMMMRRVMLAAEEGQNKEAR